jgi:endoglucanase
MKKKVWLGWSATAVAFLIPILVYCVPTQSTNSPEKAKPQSSLEKEGKQPSETRAARYERYIVVDQFGYTRGMKKVAILADPTAGWNQAERYEPGMKLEVRSAESGAVVFEGKPTPWKDGAVDEMSGDRGQWFDFTEVGSPGRYFVYDPQNSVRSDEFVIGDDAYAKVLEAALRVFYFNRANFAKVKPFACVNDKCWLQGEDYTGKGQDGEARSVRAQSSASTERDLRGGFWDAGDVNKYVTFTYAPLHQLLTAYEQNRDAFKDDLNIPESGNGIADVLDLVEVELEFLKKMQAKDLDGGVLPKVGNIAYGDPTPEASKLPRFYYPESCSSAVITVASVFAQAARVFKDVPGRAPFSNDLFDRAKRAFRHYHEHPRSDVCDDGTIRSGDSDITLEEQNFRALTAATYLYDREPVTEYLEVVKQHYQGSRLMREDRLGVYDAPVADALLDFAGRVLEKEPELGNQIRKRTLEVARTSDVATFMKERSLYRIYMRKDSYHWGSNQARANFGNSALLPVVFGLTKADEAQGFRDRAGDLLHYFHGQNPLQLVMLSNMTSYGAARSISEIYHSWFHDKNPVFDSAATSKLGPAPGYLVGGVNPSYCTAEKDHLCFGGEFANQPPEKAYLDFNTAWEPNAPYDMSWGLSEPAIYYQAAYIKLLSQFVGQGR